MISEIRSPKISAKHISSNELKSQKNFNKNIIIINLDNCSKNCPATVLYTRLTATKYP